MCRYVPRCGHVKGRGQYWEFSSSSHHLVKKQDRSLIEPSTRALPRETDQGVLGICLPLFTTPGFYVGAVCNKHFRFCAICSAHKNISM